MVTMEERVSFLEGKMDSVATKEDLGGVREQIAELRGDMSELKGEVREQIAELRGDMSELKGEVREQIAELRGE